MDPHDAPVLTDVQDAARPPIPDSLLGFCDAIKVNRAYERSSWNVDRYVQRMVGLIDDKDTDPRIVLAAMEILRKHALETLQISGQTPPLLPGGTVVAEVLPATDLLRLESMGDRTRSMLEESTHVPEIHEETPPPEENTDVNEDNSEDRKTSEHDGEATSPPKGGAEDGGAYDTEQVVGHRPPVAARPGLCDVERPGS